MDAMPASSMPSLSAIATSSVCSDARAPWPSAQKPQRSEVRAHDVAMQFIADIRGRPLLTRAGEQACAMRIEAGRLAAFEALSCFPPVYDTIAAWRLAFSSGAATWSVRAIFDSPPGNDESTDEDGSGGMSVAGTDHDIYREECFEAFDLMLQYANAVPYNIGPGSIAGAREAFSAFGFLPAQYDTMVQQISEASRDLVAADAVAACAARAAGFEMGSFVLAWRVYDPDAGGQNESQDFENRLDLAKAGAALSSLGKRVRLSIPVLRRVIALLRKAEDEIRSAKADLVNAHLRLVVSLARPWQRSKLAFSDLIQEGNLGLLRAVDKFDHTLGYKFATYAKWWIRQGIMQAVSQQSRTIRIPVRMTEKITKLSRIGAAFRRRYGRAPTEDELAAASRLPSDVVRSCLQVVTTTSLDMKIGDENDNVTLGSLIEDENSSRLDDLTYRTDLRRLITAEMYVLTAREERILRLRFGLGLGVDEHSLDAISGQMGISKERVRQLEVRAIHKLRHPSRTRRLRLAVAA